MAGKPNAATIDEIVASCRAAWQSYLRSLLLVNEQLEAELLQLYAVVAHGGFVERGNDVLH